MADVFKIIPQSLGGGEDIVLARVINDRGSAPRGSGAIMLVRADGSIAGTVGGGLVEAAAREKAAELFNSGLSEAFSFEMTGELKDGGMVCGGRVELLVEFIGAEAATAAMFETVNSDRRSGRKSYLITAVPQEGKPYKGQRWLLAAGDSPAGDEEGKDSELVARVKDSARSLAESALMEVEGRRYWVDVIVNGGTVFIFGAGHISGEVAELALRVGFNVTVLDDRAEYANSARFPAPVEVVVLKSFDNCLNGLRLDGDSYAVIVTRGHMCDKTVLQQLLNTGAGYIGMIGSARKKDTIYRALVEEGVSRERLEGVRCPIGIKIETETPEEIAVSIVGELIDVRARKRQCKSPAPRQ